MNRWTLLFTAVMACILLAVGCSRGSGNPMMAGDLTASVTGTGAKAQTHLWGYYDVYIDIPTKTATAVLNRDVMFAANVTQFLNGKASNLGFHINGTPVGTGYVDVDIDVTITIRSPDCRSITATMCADFYRQRFEVAHVQFKAEICVQGHGRAGRPADVRLRRYRRRSASGDGGKSRRIHQVVESHRVHDSGLFGYTQAFTPTRTTVRQH